MNRIGHVSDADQYLSDIGRFYRLTKSTWYEHAIFVPVGMAKPQNKTKKIFGIGLGRTSGDTFIVQVNGRLFVGSCCSEGR
jgi:hypothetical protein